MKKLLTYIGVLLLAAPISTTLISCANNKNNKSHGLVEGIERGDMSNSLIEDAKEKAIYKKDNISIFFILWGGQIQNLEVIWSIMLQKQLNPDKEIYLYLGGDAFDETIYDYKETLGKNKNGKYIFQKKFNERYGVTDEMISGIYDNLGYSKNKTKFDFYIGEEAKSQVNWDNINRGLSHSLRYSWSFIDSINFMTDGTYNFTTNSWTKTWFETKTEEDIRIIKNNIIDLLSGKTTDFISEGKRQWGQPEHFIPKENNSFETIDEALPLLAYKLKDENSFDKIKSWVVSEKPYVESGNTRYWNQHGVGIESVWNELSNSNKERFIEFYKANSQDVKDLVSSTKGFDNYILTGNKIVFDNDVAYDKDMAALEKMYEDKIIGSENRNLIMKSHPGSDANKLYKLIDEFNAKHYDEFGRNILFNLKQTVIVEIFVLSKILLNTEDTKYHFSLTGTSTAVLGFYSAGAIDMVDEFIFANPSEVATYKALYGENSSIIDWDKITTVSK